MDDPEPNLTIPGRTVSRQVIWLATPVFIEQSLLYLVGLSDTILTGRYLSKDHLAVVTVASYLLWFFGNLFTIASVGATSLIARHYGANERPEAVRICQQAILLALVVGFLSLVVGWTMADQAVRLLNLEGEAAKSAAQFFRIVIAVVPLLSCTAAGVACLRGAGDTRTGMWVMTLVNVLNITLSWSFVRGFGPFPNLGFAGIALGTAVAEGIGGLIILTVLARGRSGLVLTLRGLWPVGSVVRRMLKISVPAAGESLTNILCQLWFLSVINRLGPVATAAHGVAIRCESIAFLTIMAFSVAASTLTGQYLGAGRPDLAASAAKHAWRIGTLILMLIGTGVYVLAEPMFGLFLGGRQPEVSAEGVPVLRVVAFALPALATITVLSGALRGAGDTRWPFRIVLVGYLLVRLPLTYTLTNPTSQGGIGWGLYGAWVAMFIDLNLRGVLTAARFLHGGWSRLKI